MIKFKWTIHSSSSSCFLHGSSWYTWRSWCEICSRENSIQNQTNFFTLIIDHASGGVGNFEMTRFGKGSFPFLSLVSQVNLGLVRFYGSESSLRMILDQELVIQLSPFGISSGEELIRLIWCTLFILQMLSKMNCIFDMEGVQNGWNGSFHSVPILTKGSFYHKSYLNQPK